MLTDLSSRVTTTDANSGRYGQPDENQVDLANVLLTTAVDAWRRPWTTSRPGRRLSCSGGPWWTRVDPGVLLIRKAEVLAVPRREEPVRVRQKHGKETSC